MHEETITWLLEWTNPAVRYRTLTELLDEPQRSAAVKKAREAALQSPELEQIFARQARDGYWYYVDPKTHQPFKDPRHCKNVYYLLTILNICADFGLDKNDERPARAIRRFLSVLSKLDEEEFPQECQTLQFIRPFVMIGYRHHPQVERLVNHLLTSIRWDNGYSCLSAARKRKMRPVKSCVLATMPAIMAFSALSELWESEACKRLVDYFLRRNVLYRTDCPDKFVHRHIRRTEFPFGFAYLLGIMYSLSKMGYGQRPELAAAWALLESKRHSNGRYVLDSKSPYSDDRFNRLPELDQRHEESKWVTFYALLAKRLAGLSIPVKVNH